MEVAASENEDPLAELANLRAENALLRRQRRYGLVWEDQNEDAIEQARKHLPLITEEAGLSFGDGNRPHVLIEGDNFYSLLGLTYTHRESVDLIYIDPPYNTGKENDFRYNDRFVGEDDDFRHSKWLSFMAPRLEMAWELLTDDGVILVSIDDNEFATLRLLCDQLFQPQNFIGVFIWDGGRKNDARFLSAGHDYILAYARNQNHLRATDRKWRVRKEGIDDLYAAEERLRRKHRNDPEGLSKAFREYVKALPKDHGMHGTDYVHVDETGIYGVHPIDWPGGGGPRYDVIHPVTGKPCKVPSRGWVYPRPELMQAKIDEGRIHFGADETSVPRFKRYLKESETIVPRSVFRADRSSAEKRLADLMGANVFRFPKDVEVLKKLFRAAIGDKKRATVLDFFAGSGSTGQAVLEMNAEDAAQHRAILATAAENGISRDVCHERMRRLIAGYVSGKGKTVAGLGGALRFFTSDQEYVEHTDTPDALKRQFRRRSTDLLRLREDCYHEAVSSREYAVFTGAGRTLGILYRERSRVDLIAALREHTGDDDAIALYAFSLDADVDATPFTDAFGARVELRGVPDELIRTYERLFRRALHGGWA